MSEQAIPNPVLAEIMRLKSGIERLEKWAQTIEMSHAKGEPPVLKIKASVSAMTIMQWVCAEWEICDVAQLQQHSNRALAVEPRHVAAYLMRKVIDLSLPDIGKRLGAFHHTTVMMGIRKVEDRIAKDADFKARVESVEEKLK